MARLALPARPGCIFGSYPLKKRTLRIARINCKERPRERERPPKKERPMAGYTLVVGTRNWSSWSLRPFVALKATAAPYELVDIRLRHPDTKGQILKHSPAGKRSVEHTS